MNLKYFLIIIFSINLPAKASFSIEPQTPFSLSIGKTEIPSNSSLRNNFDSTLPKKYIDFFKNFDIHPINIPYKVKYADSTTRLLLEIEINKTVNIRSIEKSIFETISSCTPHINYPKNHLFLLSRSYGDHKILIDSISESKNCIKNKISDSIKISTIKYRTTDCEKEFFREIDILIDYYEKKRKISPKLIHYTLRHIKRETNKRIHLYKHCMTKNHDGISLKFSPIPSDSLTTRKTENNSNIQSSQKSPNKHAPWVYAVLILNFLIFVIICYKSLTTSSRSKR